MIDYNNKIILAPMVRINSLQFRLLALKYGCDLVYSEEIIDYKLAKSRRYVNNILDTIDFLDEDDDIIFRTCKEEKDRLILQIGTNCPERALKAAKIVENDVSGIDINMGCPKSFSIKGGMGAALLENPEKIKQILTNLVKNLSVPVSCKIRVLPNLDDTLKLVKTIESTNVSAIAVHGRIKTERPYDDNRIDYIKSIADIINIPVIANGESGNIKTYDDILEFKRKSNTNSVMIARAAQYNCSIFRKEGKLDKEKVIMDFLDLSLKYNGLFSNIKYTIQMMLGNIHERSDSKKFLESNTTREICELWNKEDLYDRITEEYRIKSLNSNQNQQQIVNDNQINNLNQNETPFNRKRKLIELIQNDEEADEILNIKFFPNLFEASHQLPKSKIYELARKKNAKLTYKTIQTDKRFYCICEFDGIKYLNLCLEKNKRLAEQAAALVACFKLNLLDNETMKKFKIDNSFDISSKKLDSN